MVDLPPSKPPLFLTGVDCLATGLRMEDRDKCLTARCVHLDTGAFLLVLVFIHRSVWHSVLSENGGDAEC